MYGQEQYNQYGQGPFQQPPGQQNNFQVQQQPYTNGPPPGVPAYGHRAGPPAPPGAGTF
jgi:hypothetical protein